LANVLLVSRAVLQLASRATGTPQEPHMSTPSQLTKNMITNASFRTKKMEADIARVETEEDGERMGVIRAEGLVVSMESKNSIKYREYLDLLLR